MKLAVVEKHQEPAKELDGVQVIVMKARPLLECLMMIPAKFLWAVIGNEKLEPCCRKPENLTLELRKTQDLPEITFPDLYVFGCECGRKHRRMLCNPGVYGDPAKAPKVDYTHHNPCLPAEFRGE